MKNTLTVKEASKLLGVAPDYLRWGIRSGEIPVGMAVKKKSQFKYIITKSKFSDVTGIEVTKGGENERR